MKQPEILQCLLELCSGSSVWSPTKAWVPCGQTLVHPNQRLTMPKNTFRKGLPPAENVTQCWTEEFPLRGVTGHFSRWDKPQGTSCHLNKMLFWIQLWWQLQCQVATEGNTVLFFWWAQSFEVSKMIPWDLLSKASFRQNCQKGTLFTPPPTPNSQKTSLHIIYPAPSGISLGCWWLSFPSSLGIHLSWAHFFLENTALF